MTVLVARRPRERVTYMARRRYLTTIVPCMFGWYWHT